MRLVGIIVVLLAAAGCPGSGKESLGAGNDGDDGAGGGAPRGCTRDTDCSLAAVTCCDCPSFAVSNSDPAVRACTGVQCPQPSSCPANVEAQCNAGVCELACTQLACNLTCAEGFAIDDATGCLSCECASLPPSGCMRDSDCVETRADCCGCHSGGNDTAVLASERASFDANLGCSPNPSCPSVNTCEPGAAPRCVQGRCELIAGNGLPAGACGRSDLPACPMGQVCWINRDPGASELGVGVCTPEGAP